MYIVLHTAYIFIYLFLNVDVNDDHVYRKPEHSWPATLPASHPLAPAPRAGSQGGRTWRAPCSTATKRLQLGLKAMARATHTPRWRSPCGPGRLHALVREVQVDQERRAAHDAQHVAEGVHVALRLQAGLQPPKRVKAIGFLGPRAHAPRPRRSPRGRWPRLDRKAWTAAGVRAFEALHEQQTGELRPRHPPLHGYS